MEAAPFTRARENERNLLDLSCDKLETAWHSQHDVKRKAATHQTPTKYVDQDGKKCQKSRHDSPTNGNSVYAHPG